MNRVTDWISIRDKKPNYAQTVEFRRIDGTTCKGWAGDYGVNVNDEAGERIEPFLWFSEWRPLGGPGQ